MEILFFLWPLRAKRAKNLTKKPIFNLQYQKTNIEIKSGRSYDNFEADMTDIM